MDTRSEDFVSKFVNLHLTLTDAPKDYLQIAALWTLGVGLDWLHVNAFGKREHGNLYALLVGPPFTHRKSWTIGRAVSVLKEATLGWMVTSATTFSLEGFVKRLASSNMALTVDEFRQFAYVARMSSGPASLSLINTLWSPQDTPCELMYAGKEGQNQAGRVVPAGRTLSFFAATTPEWLYESAAEFSLKELRASGLLSRILVVWPDRKDRASRGSCDVEAMEDAKIELAAMLLNLKNKFHRARTLEVDKRTWGVLTKAAEFATSSSTARCWAHCLRLSLLMSISDGSGVVKPEHAERAFQIVVKSSHAARRLAHLAIPFRAVASGILTCLAASTSRALPIATLSREIDADPAEIHRAIKNLGLQGEVEQFREGLIPSVRLMTGA